MTTDDLKKIIKENRCGFDQNLKKVTFTDVGCGNCYGELKICEEHTNKRNTMHGGMAITLVDAFTTFALLTHKDSLCVPSVSVEIYLAYLRPARRGEEILISAETIKAGCKLAFAKCLLTHKKSGDLLGVGYHTKYLMR